MLYDMRCDVCLREMEIGCPISLHSSIVQPGISCSDNNGNGCPGTLRQVMKVPPVQIKVKGEFPGTGNEVMLPTPHGQDVAFKDKHHAKDWLGERGLTSRWIENDM